VFPGSPNPDLLEGLDSDDLLQGEGGNDTLTGGAGNDTLEGGSDNDLLDGESGSDVLDGGLGDDTIEGGSESDTVSYESALGSVTVTITGVAGSATGAAGNDTLSSIERIRGSNFNDTLTVISRPPGDFVITGGAGNDTITGSAAADPNIWASYASSTSGIAATLTFDGLTYGGAVTDGLGGTDTLANIRAVEGSDHADSFFGGAGNDWFRGRAGNDTLNGGIGIEGDTADYVDAPGAVTVNLAGGSALDGYGSTDTLINMEQARGSAFADTLIGDQRGNRLDGQGGNDNIAGGLGNDVLVAGAGDDSLDGGVGADTLEGGDGTDLAIFSGSFSNYSVVPNADGSLTVADNRGVGFDGADKVTGVESFQFADRTVTLSELIATAPTNAAPSGIALSGGLVLENSASGTVVGSFSAEDPNPGDTHSFTLLDDAGGRFALSGNSLVVANGVRLDFEQAGVHTVVVRATDQTGLSIDSVLTVGVGNRAPERVIGTAASDVIVGGFGADWFSGGGGADHLRGGIGNDVLKGGSGNDRLTGGRGRDVETGGSGKDLFIFDDRDTSASRKTADYILDFRGGLGDRLDLRLVDANVKARGDQKFAFIGEAEFTRAGQVRYEHTSTDTWVYLNTDADASAEAAIRLKGVFDLSSKWFLL
jgi:Ca2+-binding RTX toxin-like protein